MIYPRYLKDQLTFLGRDVSLIKLQQGIGDCPNVVFYGDGHSVTVDTNGRVTWADPLYHPMHNVKKYNPYCTVYAVYFPRTSHGLDDAGKQLAKFINENHGSEDDTPHVLLHGHGKCGCCFISAAQEIQRPCTVMSVSAPMQGTPVADFHGFSANLNPLMKWIYQSIFSDHQVVQDIIPGSEFIQSLDLTKVPNQHQVLLITSMCGVSLNPIDWVMWLLDKLLRINGDGIVPFRSQLTTTIPSTVQHIAQRASHATSLKRSKKLRQYPWWVRKTN